MTTPIGPPNIYISESLTPLSNTSSIPGEAVEVFAAAYNQGPTVPTLVSSWSAFTQLYGNFSTAPVGNYLPYAVYQFFNNGGSSCYVLRIPNSDASTATLTLKDINSPQDNVITVNAYSPGAWGNQIYVAITTAGTTGRFNFVVYQGGTAASNIVESFVDLSINPYDSRYVLSIVNSPISGSTHVSITVTLPNNTYIAGVNDPALVSATALTGGGDGVTAPNLTTSIPLYLGQMQGQVLNVNVPGLSNTTSLNTLIAWAEEQGNVMFIIDGPAPNFPETSATVAANYVNMVSGGSPLTTSTYATLYAPWIEITNPASSLPGATIWVPPGGAILGIWNATDTKVGPWQSPAGVSYGQINLQNIETNFTTTDLTNLNAVNVNPIYNVPGYFPAVMGARTLAQGYPDRYIAVRRELIKLEHDFTNLLQFALFEPNGTDLWSQITYVLTNYLTQQFQQGVFGGDTAADSFSVVCDDTVNTPATSQAGIVNCNVAVSLLSPAEFILINISQFQSTASTTITTSTSTT